MKPKVDTAKTLQAILGSIETLVAEYRKNGGPTEYIRSKAIQLQETILISLGDLSEQYVQFENNDDLNQFLEMLVSAMAAVLEITGGTAAIQNLPSNLIAPISDAMSNNQWFVQNVVGQYLLDYQIEKYKISESRTRAINDLLDLAVRPSMVVDQSVVEDIKAYYHLVRNDLRHRNYPRGYTVSKRWQEIVDRSMEMAGYINNPVHIAMLGLHGASFTHHSKGLSENEKKRLRYYRDWISWNYPEIEPFGESSIALHSTVVDVGGVRYSEGFQACLYYYTEIASSIGKSQNYHTVIEIGSGYGRLARLFHLAKKCKKYVLVDLPESLFFAYAFLKTNLPDASFIEIKSPEDAAKAMKAEFDFVFCPVQSFADLLSNSVDLVINTYSFGEMPQGCINHLLSVIETKIKPRWFFSMNTMFQDRSLHYENTDNSGQSNGSEIVLNISPMWWPSYFSLSNVEIAGNDGKPTYYNAAVVLMEKHEVEPENLVDELQKASNRFLHGTREWIQYMYFVAIWTADPDVIEEFLDGLAQWMNSNGVNRQGRYRFENIGEVSFLRRRCNSLLPERMSAF